MYSKIKGYLIKRGEIISFCKSNTQFYLILKNTLFWVKKMYIYIVKITFYIYKKVYM